MARALSAELKHVCFPFPSSDSAKATEIQEQLVQLLDDELIPQLAAQELPTVIGLVGPTGSGKSVVANSLIGQALSPVTAFRPTTRAPQVLANPRAPWLLATHPAFREGHAVTNDQIPLGLVVVDFADPFAAGNRAESAQPDLPADAWMVVTTALRYGDAVVWDLMATLLAQEVPVALVINRINLEQAPAIEGDVMNRLAQRGWGQVAVLTVPAVEKAVPGLPTQLIEPLTDWLAPTSAKDISEPDADSPLPGLLIDLLDKTKRLVEAQRLHQAAVEMLRQATAKVQADAVASAASSLTFVWQVIQQGEDSTLRQAQPEAAEPPEATAPPEPDESALPPPSEAQLAQAAWLKLASAFEPWLTQGQPAGKGKKAVAKLNKALVQFGRAVTKLDNLATAQLAAKARGQVAALWTGTTVPQGSRKLARAHGLEPATEQGDGQNQGTDTASNKTSTWTKRLVKQLARSTPGQLEPAPVPLAPKALAALIQGATLGAAGPSELLSVLLPDQAEELCGGGWRTRVSSHRAAIVTALEPFEEALRQVSVEPSALLVDVVLAFAPNISKEETSQ